ncbi:MAG: NUDIX hydrolase [Lentisphaeria bacterium]|nr:NUDIX hydrolase [Lentisphaeria bacterium]
MYKYSQSAVIPYLYNEDVLHVVLVSTNSGNGWVFPKGLLEEGMTPWDSAAKEALEEAGITGVVGEVLFDYYEYEKWGGICEVNVFLLAVRELAENWDESFFRKRIILKKEEALKKVKKSQKETLIKFFNHME